jgi:hypothetical protein
MSLKGSDGRRSDTLACPDTIQLLDFAKISDRWFGGSTARARSSQMPPINPEEDSLQKKVWNVGSAAPRSVKLKIRRRCMSNVRGCSCSGPIVSILRSCPCLDVPSLMKNHAFWRRGSGWALGMASVNRISHAGQAGSSPAARPSDNYKKDRRFPCARRLDLPTSVL